MNDYVYLYGFTPADTSPPRNLAGVGGSAIEALPLGGLNAVVNRVPAATYDPEQMEARLQDLTWVAEQGIAHERVVAWFVDHAQILPAPLFTMYSSDAALRDAIAARADAVQRELARLRNKREWDLKVSFNEKEVQKHASALSPAIAQLDRDIDTAAPGKRFLLERKRRELLKDETRAAAQRQAQAALDAVKNSAVDTRILPIPRAADDLPVILYAALLIERDSEVAVIEVLEREITRLERLGLDLSFSGPWAPYRFTEEDERQPD